MQTTCVATTRMVFYSLSILVPSKKDFNTKKKEQDSRGNRPRESILLNLCRKGASYPPQNNLVHHLNGQLVEETVRRKRSTGIPIFNTGTSLQVYGQCQKGRDKGWSGFGDVSKLHRAKGGASQKATSPEGITFHTGAWRQEGACDEEYVSPMKQNLSFV